jgi:hypothetical protein
MRAFRAVGSALSAASAAFDARQITRWMRTCLVVAGTMAAVVGASVVAVALGLS